MVIDLGVRTNKLHKPISNFSILVPKFETNFLIHACVHDLGTVSVMGVNLDNTQFYMLDLFSIQTTHIQPKYSVSSVFKLARPNFPHQSYNILKINTHIKISKLQDEEYLKHKIPHEMYLCQCCVRAPMLVACEKDPNILCKMASVRKGTQP